MAAVAVVVVIGSAGIALALSRTSSDDGEVPSPAVAATVAPTTVAPTTVAPHREAGDFEGSSVGVTYTVPDGWETRFKFGSQPSTGGGDEVFKGDPVFGVTFVSADDNFYTNYCPSGPVGLLVGPTIDDLVSAFASLPGVDATAASDVTIDGFDGKQIEFTVPDYNYEDCDGMFYRCSSLADPGRLIRCVNVLANRANQHLRISFLDVDGARHMILAGTFADTSQQDGAALDEIVASIQIVETPTVIVSFGVESANNTPVRFTAPDDWTVASGFAVYNDSAGVVFDDISNIYTDVCQGVLLDPPVGPTVDDLVAAWANLPDLAATAAVGITVGPYAGKQIEFTVPDYTASECRENKYALWDVHGLSIEDAPGYWAQGVGHHLQMWVLDVDGTRLVIAARTFPDTSVQDRAALDEVLASIEIGCDIGRPNSACNPADALPNVTSPIELVRRNLTSGAAVELFRVTTDEPTYWRVITLPEFDGRMFRHPTRTLARIDDTANSEPDGRTIRQQLQILALQGKLLPAAADPIQVEPNTDIRVVRDTNTLVKTTELAAGDQFTIVSEAPDATPDEMRAATTDNPPDNLFLELPDNVSDVVYDLASEVTTGATTDYDRLIALQNWFRTFDYSTDVESGHGFDAIENFLVTRSGFSEQFAATFAVMARTLGIPSRVAVGFAPGKLNTDGSYSVFAKHSHAWPEVWFNGIGWVQFEPTPPRGIPDADDQTAVEADQQPSP